MSRSRCDKHRPTPASYRIRTGLTLLEMVIVLGILAVLTSVAVRSLEPLADQARYETTQRQLDAAQAAVADPQPIRQPDGTVSMSGFVADVGRLPVAQGAGTLQLAELWEESLWGNLGLDFGFQVRSGPSSPIDYRDIKLPCGWRGPYLHPSRPELGVFDGWGNPFIAELDEIRGVPQIDRLVWNPLPGYEALQSDWSHAMTTVSGVLTDGGEPAEGTVVLLYPDPAQSTLAVMADGDEAADESFTFHNVPIGLRAIRATINGQSVTRYIQVPPSGLTLTLGVNQ